MDWQQAVSLMIVIVAAGALLWGRLGRRRFSFKRDTPCGCGAGSQSPPPGIVFRARKGHPTQVQVKTP